MGWVDRLVDEEIRVVDVVQSSGGGPCLKTEHIS